ncbi:MAG: TIGR03668 family PPOX class F420-dependent oxidoreductase [Pseudomonadota bacterium]
MLSAEQSAFLDANPVARLATADASGAPHVIPICYVVVGNTLFFGIDEKPKSASTKPLKRIRNLIENPKAAVVVDRYSDDWSQLGWVMIRGPAEILENCSEQVKAHEALRARYPQYREMYLEPLPVVAIRIRRVVSWGNLS